MFAEKVQGSKEQTRLMNVYRVTDSLFNAYSEAAANSLPCVEAVDLDNFFPAAQQSTLHHEEEAGPMGEKKEKIN